MKDLNDWSCEALMGEDASFTVGTKFAILCRGTQPLAQTDQFKIIPNDSEHKFNLVPLKVNFKSEYEVSVLAALWKVGQYKPKNYQLVLGNQTLLLKGPDIKVKSTLQGDKMNMPPGPAQDPIPKWIGIGGLLILLYFIFRFVRSYRRGRRCDRGLFKLNQFKTGLSPYFEFQRQVRLVYRELEGIEFHKNPEKMIRATKRLIDVCEDFRKKLEAFVSLEINRPLFALSPKEGREEMRKKKIPYSIVQNYYETNREIECLIEDLSSQFAKDQVTGHPLDEMQGANDERAEAYKRYVGVKRGGRQRSRSPRGGQLQDQKGSNYYVKCKKDFLVLVDQSREFADRFNQNLGVQSA